MKKDKPKLPKKVFAQGTEQIYIAFGMGPFPAIQFDFYYDKLKNYTELTFLFIIDEIINNDERLSPNFIAQFNRHRSKGIERAQAKKNFKELKRELTNAENLNTSLQ